MLEDLKMGWSCRAEAYKILGAWSNACYRQTGSSNEFNVKYKKYFFEVSRTEHIDIELISHIL